MKTTSLSAVRQVLVVDDHPIVREGLRRKIEAQSGMTVCAEASGMSEALRLIRKQPVDIAIVDISLEGRSGLELIKQVRSSGYTFPILVLSIHEEAIYAQRALTAGAQGYLSKKEGPGKIIDAINHLLRGDFYFSRRTANKLFHLLGRRTGHNNLFERLSDRELEVLEAMGRGQTTRQISDTLHLSVSTIETYKSRIKTKLGLSNAAQLSSFASMWLNRSQE